MSKIFSLFLALMAYSDNSSEEYLCRVTYYHPHQDKWGSRVACPNTKRATEGVTVAAHPDFSFGTKIYIPDLKGVVGNGRFIVQDRGSAVTKKRASHGKAYVFDVYLKNRPNYHKCIKNKTYMRVIISRH
jgi:hypothetical protein|tara:strand:+ start:252 stop:641 length:390 start_codon:yes stop_codon:yes gene_type:complete